MIQHGGECEKCDENGDTICCCKFCVKCGCMSHTIDKCNVKQCFRCKGFHIRGQCPSKGGRGGLRPPRMAVKVTLNNSLSPRSSPEIPERSSTPLEQSDEYAPAPAVSSSSKQVCKNCTRNGYDDCLCWFCSKCGNLGHKREDCQVARCCRCKGRHLSGECPSGGQGIFQGGSRSSSYMDSESWTLANIGNRSPRLNPGSQIEHKSSYSEPRVEEDLKKLEDLGAAYATESSITLGNIGPTSRTSILEHLMSQVENRYRERYISCFKSSDTRDVLEQALAPAVRGICEHGNFTLSGLISIGRDPADLKCSGVYLHILWRRNHPQNFWLYIGQARNLSERIKTHKNIYHRRNNPSLHYHVWDSSEHMESVFVTLAIYDTPNCSEGQLLLNLLEMWMCLVFQTLPSLRLREFLPDCVDIGWSGCHLNVALPLWQGFTGAEEYSVMEDATGGRVCFQQYLQSEDWSIRQWAENARDSFNDIRNSPDPLLRKYYDDLRQARLVSSSKTWQGKKVDRLKQYLSGTNKKVQVSHNGEICEIGCGIYRFTISQKSRLDLKDGDEVFFQLHLNELTHPRAYAQIARPSDPASRLAASISNSDRVRGGFYVFLQTKGSLNVKKMNSLVDALEGYSLEESRSFIGRWHTKKSTSHGEQARVHVYT